MEFLANVSLDFLMSSCLKVTSVSVDTVMDQGTRGGPSPGFHLQSTLTLHIRTKLFTSGR